MKYRTNIRVPKPSTKIEQEKVLPTIFLKEYSTIEIDKSGYIRISHPDFDYNQTLWSIDDLQAIIAFEPLEFDSNLITTFMRSQIPIVILDSQGGVLGRIEPSYKIRPDILQAQSLMSSEQKVRIMQAVAWSKLRRLRRFLSRSSRENSEELTEACQRLKEAINLVYRQDNVDSLQGMIGHGMLLFYNALPSCLNQDWRYTGRRENSPIVRMLNFSNKLLEESVKIAINSVGLNPAHGYWHSSYKSQLGLVADFVSEFQLFAESAVVRACNRGQVVPKDFDNCWDSEHLPKIAVSAIADSFEKKMNERFTYPHTNLNCSYQELLYLQAKQLTWFLTGEIDEYYSPDIK
ncbi:CRISPR-associated endonuclease Cas1 [Anabaena azotica]|uniref:CRISPR-associated endonuclease Cas1 n=1 Tax=Anabaena azotica FACHB-119 TaxID=947527 RepID=A0ABR8DFC4_9NOST|nr:CRISPR-associated endonuclease Cas1 [Anabaena azotica]MBD2505339.1 CRISPR-associated endonuclease Cas1 [Anabaena azotica FACHB-119]